MIDRPRVEDVPPAAAGYFRRDVDSSAFIRGRHPALRASRRPGLCAITITRSTAASSAALNSNSASPR